MTLRVIVVELRAPDGSAIRLQGHVGEALLAVALALAEREDRLNRMDAWSLDLNCGRKDLKLNIRENVQPIEFRSALGS